MLFRSLTADRTLLNIYTKEIDSDDPDEGKSTFNYWCNGLKRGNKLERSVISSEVTGYYLRDWKGGRLRPMLFTTLLRHSSAKDQT